MKSSSSIPLSRFAETDEVGRPEIGSSLAMPPDDQRPRDFGSFYRATLTPLRRYLARMLGNTSEAQDVAHDAYMRVFPGVTDEKTERPEALLYVTARRLAINRLRRRNISPLAPEGTCLETAAATTPGVAQQVMARQEWRMLEEAIAKLPEGCRTVLLLRKVELLSHREIADRLGIAISTVEKQHARALRLLKAALPPDRPLDASRQSPEATS